jgi:hypothetical protein
MNPYQAHTHRLRVLGNLCVIASILLSSIGLWLWWKHGVSIDFLAFFSGLLLACSAAASREARCREK